VWYRSQNLIAGGGVAGRLSRAFKLGTAFMAIALMVELSVDFEIGIAQLLIPFFGASLIGLAAARLPKSGDAGQASWPVVIGVTVFAILAIGAIGGLATGRYGANGVRGLLNLWGQFVDGIIWLLRWPIELAMRAMWAIILWLQNVFRGEPQDPEEIGASAPLSQEMDSTVQRA